MVVKEKLECEWSSKDGYRFSFGNKRLWERNGGYIVADVEVVIGFERYINHQKFSFTELWEALTYMRTGKRL